MKKTTSQKAAISKAMDALKEQAIQDSTSLKEVKGGDVFPVDFPVVMGFFQP